jgi:hypothetical protein
MIWCHIQKHELKTPLLIREKSSIFTIKEH